MTFMGISDYGSFCLAVLVFLALPGPGTFALLTSTAKGGFRAGAAATFGVIAGDQALLWMAVGGIAALLTAHPVAFKLVQYAGAGYLIWMGAGLLLARDGARSPVRIEPRRYARQAFLITLLNPKAIVFYMAFFPLFINPVTHRGTSTFAAMAVTIGAITVLYGLGLCAFAAAVSRHFSARPALARWMQRGAGACLIGFGVRLSSH
jgi:threonine/homoserine/homoserine lactone efflux protein